jgi:hypothetical protein
MNVKYLLFFLDFFCKKMFDLIPDYVIHAPFYHIAFEGFLVIWILWLIFRKSYKPAENSKLTEKVSFQISNNYLI